MAESGNDEKTEALHLLAQAKRNILCGEVHLAVQQLQDSCRKLATEYGETADECAEAYLTYGGALLDLGRMDSGVLGNALQQDAAESGDDDEDDDEDDEKSKEDNSTEESDKDERASVRSEELDENEEKKLEEVQPATNGTLAKDSNGQVDSGPTVSPTDEPDEEDVSNMQLAWEMLELAKIIFLRRDASECQLKAADAFLRLGEVGLETEQYDQAVSDFTECLVLQQTHLEPDSRLIAETLYQIGLASLLACHYDQAIEKFQEALKVMEAKIKSLETFVEKASAEAKQQGTFSPEVIQAEKEIDDLRSILPDVRNKIEDTEEEKKTQESARAMLKDRLKGETSSSSMDANSFGEGFPSSSGGNLSASSSLFSEQCTDATFTCVSSTATESGKIVTPISDISHMVRKKRKAEEPIVEAPVSKKLERITDGASGDATASASETK